ncbi:hypothetical protein NP493_846g00002 [Ridgeia piscesae]|uniref:Major facilitator superfamily (MFS) profile domain-containing protein n=1 Tax=Ridgeia piscesae TaxID=27915 RepID=A0AAD9NNS3_RIDPI|nr:hypothetical protein NP493_846g00002 [Ridgeia piscesae]
MDANEAMSSLGDPWRKPWQMLMYFLIRIPSEVIPSWQMMAIIFIGAEPKHRCRLPDAVSPSEAIPYRKVSGERIYDSCVVYENYSSATNRKVPCPLGWEYEQDSYTITEQWDLVCSDNYGSESTQMFLVIGVIVGSLTVMPIADKFGRKRTFLISACAGNLVLFVTAWVNNYYVFIALRLLVGVFLQGTMMPAYVLSCELFPARQRTMAGVILMQVWSVSLVVLAGLAYFVRNWRHLLIITSFPGVFMIPLFWIIPESVPWLIANNRLEEAKQILHKAARWNKVELPQKYRPATTAAPLTRVSAAENEQNCPLMTKEEGPVSVETTTQYTMVDLFRSRRLTVNLLVMFYLWFVICLVYYGLSLTSGTLAGNKYLNVCLSGAIEIPAYITCAIVLKYLGRRWPMFVFFSIAGLSLLATLVIPQTTASGTDLSVLIVTLNMVGKFGITATFGGIFLYTTEIFPTTIRNIAFGLASAGGRMGSLASPYSTYFLRVAPWFPGVVFGTMAIIAATLTLLLPETLGRALPQTIEEVENWNGRKERPHMEITVTVVGKVEKEKIPGKI